MDQGNLLIKFLYLLILLIFFGIIFGFPIAIISLVTQEEIYSTVNMNLIITVCALQICLAFGFILFIFYWNSDIMYKVMSLILNLLIIISVILLIIFMVNVSDTTKFISGSVYNSIFVLSIMMIIYNFIILFALSFLYSDTVINWLEDFFD